MSHCCTQSGNLVCGYLHEALRTAGQIAERAEVRGVGVRIDETLVEATHREGIEDDLCENRGRNRGEYLRYEFYESTSPDHCNSQERSRN